MKKWTISISVFSVLSVFTASLVDAGPLAPAPRVITERDRDFLERSGAQTLEELLDTGIVRYFYTGGQPLTVLVNGKPYGSTAGDLDTLPLSAIERLELLSGDSLGTLGGHAIRGAINVVLRKDLNGFETRALTRLPDQEGGDGFQGSVFWGGAVGEGHMVLGVDALRRQEIPARSRDHSRSVWTKDGNFSEAKNVSVGGNTVWAVTSGRNVRSVALGECDPAKGYTGPLRNPPGIRNGDKGCGFAYGDIAWDTSRFNQRTVILNLEHPLGERAELRLDANVGHGEWAFRFAPSVGTFPFRPTAGVVTAINEAAGSNITDDAVYYAVAHRFVGHGNRDWKTKYAEYDISLGIEGRLTNDLGYDAHIDAFKLKGSLSGDTFVHEGKIREEIRAGRYDLVDPFSTDPEHLQAIRDSSLQEEIDFGQEYLGTRLALEGNTFSIGGRNAAWTTGFTAGKSRVHSIMRFRDNDDETHDVTQVLGSGGVSYAGERETVGLFTEMSLPLTESLDFRIAGRGDDYDDVGQLRSWNLSAEYRPHDVISLRSSLSAGQSAPSMRHLYSTKSQNHPYIECDPGPGDPPRSCPSPNPRQVTREITGNPELDPSDTKRFAIGAEARTSGNIFSVEWYRLSRFGLVGVNNADWAMQNLVECEGDERSNCIERTGGDITIHDSYANIVETEIKGVTTRFRSRDFRTGLGELRISGAWRHVIDAERRIAGNEDRYALSKNMARLRFQLKRGSLNTIWTTNYRAGFENRSGTGRFESWTGHDLVLDWKEPWGFEGMRAAVGVFNLTDAGLTVDTANPSIVDGPTAAGWGRTFFLTLNMRF